MALTWMFTDRIGLMHEKVNDTVYSYNVYEGNAPIIALMESKAHYNLAFFVCDIDHLRNMESDSNLDFSTMDFTFTRAFYKRNKKLVSDLMLISDVTIVSDDSKIGKFLYEEEN